MRWALVVGSLGLTGCLATPPSGLAGDPDGGAADDEDGDPTGSGTLVLTGIAARDPLTLDMRDELVLVARRNEDPVALLLFPGPEDLEGVTAMEVPLPFEPVDLTISRWGPVTGLAIALAPDGRLLGIDKVGASFDLSLTEDGEPTALAVQQLAELNLNGRRLTLADGGALYVTDPLEGGGQPGEEAIEIHPIGEADGPILVESSFAGGATGAIGVVEGDLEIDVYPATAPEEPEIGPDRVVGDVVPAGLQRSSWQMSLAGAMVLVGIDPAGPRLWFHSTSMGDVENSSGTALDGEYDRLHDLLVTRLDAAGAELAVLADEGGQLEVVVYQDPGDTPETLPPALVFPLSGLTGPAWMQAMDAVFDEGDPGQNEIVVYDEAGHLACIDLAGDQLVSCGSLDLVELLLKASGASTSGRPGW